MKTGEAAKAPAKRAGDGGKSNKIRFTPKGVHALRGPAKGHRMFWDKGDGSAPGLSLAVNAGSKTFRSNFLLGGKPFSRKIGRLGEMVTDADLAKEYAHAPDELKRMTRQQRLLTKIGMEISLAHDTVRDDRAKAAKGIDPREPEEDASPVLLYKDAVALYIEMQAKPRQRSWEQTEAVLLRNCKDWLDRDVRSITIKDANAITDNYIRTGRGPTAAQTSAWLKQLWRFLWRRGDVDQPLMDMLKIEYEEKVRDRWFNDDEIMDIWDAAGKFNDPVLTGYFRLLLLTAPRKSALAWMRHEHITTEKIVLPRLKGEPEKSVELDVWLTPHSLVKAAKTSKVKRVYKTPLTPFAKSVLQTVIDHKPGTGLVFEGRDMGVPIWPGSKLKRLLVKQGAPEDFTYHACRDTLGTWIQNQGHTDYEQKLLLNHAITSGATANYAHGHPLLLKLDLLQKWSDHVEAVVSAD